jgi:hypothetical protein
MTRPSARGRQNVQAMMAGRRFTFVSTFVQPGVNHCQAIESGKGKGIPLPLERLFRLLTRVEFAIRSRNPRHEALDADPSLDVRFPELITLWSFLVLASRNNLAGFQIAKGWLAISHQISSFDFIGAHQLPTTLTLDSTTFGRLGKASRRTQPARPGDIERRVDGSGGPSHRAHQERTRAE